MIVKPKKIDVSDAKGEELNGFLSDLEGFSLSFLRKVLLTVYCIYYVKRFSRDELKKIMSHITFLILNKENHNGKTKRN
jgi:hypothetical protein